MVMVLLNFVKGSKSAEGGKNPPADLDPRGPILGVSKSAGTPDRARGNLNISNIWRGQKLAKNSASSKFRPWSPCTNMFEPNRY